MKTSILGLTNEKILAIYLLLMHFLLAFLLIAFWPEVLENDEWDSSVTIPGMLQFSISTEYRLMVLVILSGALGSYMYALRSFVSFIGTRRLQASWILWYLIRPFSGATLALLLYLAIRGGFFPTDANASDINTLGIVSVAFLAGLFSNQVTDKLGELSTSLAKTEKKRALKKEKSSGPSLPPPPVELVQAITSGEAVLFSGAGLSARSQFPTWRIFIQNLVKWAADEKYINEKDSDALLSSIESGAINSVADSIINTLQELKKENELNSYLRQIFIEPLQHPPMKPLPRSHRLLSKIGFSACLTSNFDILLEETFMKSSARVYTPQDSEELLNAFVKNQFFILKLYGSLDIPESVLIAPAQYKEIIAKNRPLSKFMGNLFFSRTLFFIGTSLEGIEDFLGGMMLQQGSSRRHYALVGVVGTAWQAQADLLQRRFGVEVLAYDASEGHSDVDVFLEKLEGNLSFKSSRIDEEPGGHFQEKRERSSRLMKLKLENIGPFDKLELDLDPHWNIFLGDNGVGKSSILKAIATGVCGIDAQPYVDHLIKINEISAKITLETTNRKEYLTELFRTDAKAEVNSIPLRPLESEGWLALGFPPIRTLTRQRVKGPEPVKGKARPIPDDLLPIITGEVDPRLDKLKQWIVNLDYRIKSEMSRNNRNRSYEMLLQEFFRIINIVTEGMKIEFKEVDPATNEVMVITDDGEVPIESLSQGSASLIGWIGVVLQRLYDIYGHEARSQRRCIVLMDEIDAHMHPAWQQKLITNLLEIFPNVQFIATSHSPFIVGGMEPGQVFRLIRDKTVPGRITVKKIDKSFRGWRIDQIVTTLLFGLESSRDLETHWWLERYTHLSARDSLSANEIKELEKIADELKLRLPSAAEKKEAREASKIIRDSLKSQWRNKPPEEKQKIMEEIDVQMQELITGSRRPK